jgi:hypothetical protein
MILLLLVLLLLFGGGGGYYGNRTWGPTGGVSIFTIVLVIILCV